MLKIINKRKYLYIFSSLLILASIWGMISYGLKLGIDFTGGSLLEVDYVQNRPSSEEMRTNLADLNLEGLNMQSIGTNGYQLRFKDTSEEVHQKLVGRLVEKAGGDAAQIVEKRYESVGPSIGQELKTKAFYSVLLASLAIIIYIAIAFRKVSHPISSWKYGTTAVVALIHDLVITTGIFTFLGHYFGIEVNAPFIAALLTILGYSVNDTIVVFDRTRENLHKYEGAFEEIMDKSIRETLGRSINTLVTVELALAAILIFGGTTIFDFVLALLIGLFFGGYSSIFVASALLVTWHKFEQKIKA